MIKPLSLNALRAILLLACTTGAVSAQTRADPSLSLSVTGTIKPAGCTVDLSGRGVFDLGARAVNTLDATQPTVWKSPAAQTLSIACPNPTAVAYRLDDAKRDTISANAGTLLAPTGNQLLGLGQYHGNNIGAWHMTIESMQGSRVTDTLNSTDGGKHWSVSTGKPIPADPGVLQSLTYNGVPAPLPVTTVTMELVPQVVTDGTSFFGPVTDNLHLDGEAVLNLSYL